MKKVFALILVVLMVFGMTVQAFAQEESSVEWERLLPALSEGSSGLAMFYNMKDIQQLSEEDQKLMEQAQAQLDEARPADLALKYFCMAAMVDSESAAALVFEPIEHDEIQFKQYVDGAWMLLDHTVNQDETITVEGVVDGPLAIFTNDTRGTSGNESGSGKKHDSVSARKENLLPVISKESSLLVLLHSTEMVPQLSEEIQDLMAEAKAKLKDACPEGCAVKFFCYTEIIGDADTVTVEFEKIEAEKIYFKQFVAGKWVELSSEVNQDGSISVKDVKEGPTATFTK